MVSVVRRDIRHPTAQRAGGNKWPETAPERDPVFYLSSHEFKIKKYRVSFRIPHNFS
jgi:hypothetical protein